MSKYPAAAYLDVMTLSVRQLSLLAMLVLPSIGCGSNSPAGPAPNVSIENIAGEGQAALAGMSVATDPTVLVRNPQGQPMPGVTVTFTVVQAGGATTDTLVETNAAGRASTTWYLGPSPAEENRLRASFGSASVSFTATSQAGFVGSSYFGERAFIEYIPGNLPIVISVPHDGTIDATDIPPRTFGVVSGRDTNTDPLARAISDAFFARTGKRPHLIFCRLSRSDLDANREIVEAAQGSRAAELAWYEYHAFIRSAKAIILADSPTGFYMDLHGHGHTIPRLELGYLLTSSDLQLANDAFNSAATVNKTSIRTLANSSGTTLANLLRGPTSLGTLFEQYGFPAVPSASQPDPGSNPYFNGGYNTATHGSQSGGAISGFQLEAHSAGVRNNAENRTKFAAALVLVFEEFLRAHGGLEIGPP